METRIILVRHGQTHFNAEGRLQGRLDIPLSHEGRRQVASLAERLAAMLDDAVDCTIASSPLTRARSTAEVVSRRVNLPLRIDPRLTEVSFGTWEGLTLHDIDAGWPDAPPSFRMSWATLCPDGETYQQAIDRADGWLRDFRDRNVLVVTHGVIGSLIRGRYAGLAKEEMLRLPVGHDQIVVLANGREERHCAT